MPPVDPSRLPPSAGQPITFPAQPHPLAAMEAERVAFPVRQPKGPAPKTTYHTLTPKELPAGLPSGTYQQSSEGKIEKVADAAKPDADAAGKFREPVDELLNVVDAAANAHRMTRKGGMASNSLGRFLGQKIPGTETKDLSGYMDTIRANTAFKTLQQMRHDSPTGGAVGNVSDADMRLLGSTISSLDMGQSTPKFQQDLATILQSYKKVLSRLPGGQEAYHQWRLKWLGYDPAKRNKTSAVSPDVEAILHHYGVK